MNSNYPGFTTITTTAPKNYTKIPVAVSVPAHLHTTSSSSNNNNNNSGASNMTNQYTAPQSGSLLARAQERVQSSQPSAAPYLVLFSNSIVPLRLSEAVQGRKTNNDGSSEDPKAEEQPSSNQDEQADSPEPVACTLPIRGCVYKKKMEHEVSFARRTAISLLRRYIGLPNARQIQAQQEQIAQHQQQQQQQHHQQHQSHSQQQQHPSLVHRTGDHDHPKPPPRPSISQQPDQVVTSPAIRHSDSTLQQSHYHSGTHSQSQPGTSSNANNSNSNIALSGSQQFSPYRPVQRSQSSAGSSDGNASSSHIPLSTSHPKLAKTWSIARAAMSFLDRYVSSSEERRDVEQQLNALTVFNDRVGKFFDGWEEPRPVELRVCVGGQMVTHQIVFPRSGHFEIQIKFTPEELSEFCKREILERKREFKIHKTFTWLSSRVSLVNEPSQMVASDRIMLLKPEGLSIVSDIDDTIKVSQVASIRSLLTNTFSSSYRSVEGMAKVYKAWGKKYGCAFHYVSASPWALYEPLVQFIQQNGFPKGSFHLRDFNWKESGFLYLFTEATIRSAKTQEILRLIETFPARTFVLVGDSGESDPELYAAIAKAHPQVKKILIRDHGNKMTKERVCQAFLDLSPERWSVFTDSAELYNSIDEELAAEDSESDQDILPNISED